jgi:PadR family transcriptional regulator, regulatory protein PadR
MTTGKKQNYRHLPAFILLILADKDLHGGGIHTELMQQLPSFNSDTGAVYRALQELESSGAVKLTWDTPETGSARKIYSITENGRKELEFWKKDIEMRVANLNYFLETYAGICARHE